MSLLTESMLIKSANEAIRDKSTRGMEKTASQVISEYNTAADRFTQFHFFICHAKIDEKLILGLIHILNQKGFSTYVDWINDPCLDRGQVTAETAKVLKRRIESSNCLLYAFTDNSSHSKWMPWELGIKDGHNGKVVICPIKSQEVEEFRGQEYLGIYPYLDITTYSLLPDLKYLKVIKLDNTQISLQDWMNR